jgi:hypothetical protein
MGLPVAYVAIHFLAHCKPGQRRNRKKVKAAGAPILSEGDDLMVSGHTPERLPAKNPRPRWSFLIVF